MGKVPHAPILIEYGLKEMQDTPPCQRIPDYIYKEDPFVGGLFTCRYKLHVAYKDVFDHFFISHVNTLYHIWFIIFQKIIEHNASFQLFSLSQDKEIYGSCRISPIK